MEVDEFYAAEHGWDGLLLRKLGSATSGRLQTLARAANREIARLSLDETTGLTDERRQHYENEVGELISWIAADTEIDKTDKSHLLHLLSELQEALRVAGPSGDRKARRAAESLVADAVLRRDLWDRIADRRWVQRTATVVGGLLLALGAVGGYSDVKALVADVWHPVPAITAGKDSGLGGSPP